MRTLAQVWVFFVGITLVLLVIGFQLGSRLGLFIAFAINLLLIYATLHRGLALFKKHLNVKELTGNDTTGFIQLIEKLSPEYGMKKVYLNLSVENSPPLVWKTTKDSGYIMLHQNLLAHLNLNEKTMLAHLMLSHLKQKTILIPRLLSIFEQGFLGLNYLLAPLVTLLTFLIRQQSKILKADHEAMLLAGFSNYEMGYFLHKLHHFQFHKAQSLKGAEFFSAITVSNWSFWKSYGLPSLNLRLIKLMGFVP